MDTVVSIIDQGLNITTRVFTIDPTYELVASISC